MRFCLRLSRRLGRLLHRGGSRRAAKSAAPECTGRCGCVQGRSGRRGGGHRRPQDRPDRSGRGRLGSMLRCRAWRPVQRSVDRRLRWDRRFDDRRRLRRSRTDGWQGKGIGKRRSNSRFGLGGRFRPGGRRERSGRGKSRLSGHRVCTPCRTAWSGRRGLPVHGIGCRNRRQLRCAPAGQPEGGDQENSGGGCPGPGQPPALCTGMPGGRQRGRLLRLQTRAQARPQISRD